jgi:GntR family transcriptional regulator, rspAB operon transcriptional repressor
MRAPQRRQPEQVAIRKTPAGAPAQSVARRAPSLPRPLTSAARIHAALRDRIVSLELAPGAPLSEKELVEMFGVSRTPVREALLRLAEEELVDIYPQSGTFVARIRASVAQDAMAIRKALEGFCAREAARRTTPADIAHLDALLARQRVAAEFHDIEGFHSADEAMHQLVASLAGHPNIWRVVKREKASVDRVRLLTLEFEGRFGIVVAEHQRIVDALRARDPNAAEEAMSTHLSRVLPSLEAIRARHPDYFEDEDAPQSPSRRAAKPQR